MPFYLRTMAVWPPLPADLTRLRELAYNLWWTWQPAAQELFARPDPGLWEAVGHNPVAAILRLAPGALLAAAATPEYRELYGRVMAAFDRYMTGPTWFEQRHPDRRRRVVAYFSAEFGLHECLPIYSGGLGLLAGDHCKAASDLGLPLVGVGILYKHGYFTQEIDREGRQEAAYPHLNFAEMPIIPVTDAGGQELLVPVELPGRTVYLRVWRAQVGRVPVYLLDADTPKNRPEDRLLTGQLYGGDQETRIAQEMLLGIGGVRALRAMGVCPSVWHINEGHAAFSLVERLRELVQQGVAVDTALEAIRSCTLFTTHTPVPAGHDVFAPELVDGYFGRLYTQLGLNRETFLQLGWDQARGGFNMTLLAFRYSSFTNAVSRLHRTTTRRMLAHLYPDIPVEEIPVDAVTNGVHTATWLAPEWAGLFDRHLAPGWREEPEDFSHWEQVATVPDPEIWETHCRLKAKALRFVRERIRDQRLRNHEPPARVAEVEGYLNPEVLTIGFARRFATYKRATLILRDLERLSRLVNNPDRPVQIVFAGKAHPADRPGQEMIRHIHEIINREPFRNRIFFLENYDMNAARYLTQGVDVWLNTPRRPLEASGTSGQKAALNGVVNCSILDGWWPEAYDGGNGFAIGSDRDYEDEQAQDEHDATALYALLEEAVVPAFYERTGGIPLRWVALMKGAWQTIPPRFNTGRMVREYTERFYLPLMERGEHFAAQNYAAAHRVQAYRRFMLQNWQHVKVLAVEVNGAGREFQAGDVLTVVATVYLGPVWHRDVAVELVYRTGDPDTGPLHTLPMVLQQAGTAGTYEYAAPFTLPQGVVSFTVRVRVVSPDFAHTFDLPLVTWAPEF